MRISDWSSDVCSSDLAGVRLQIALPRARVIYVSATGATKPENLSYTARLGLWGPGTAFRDRDAFLAAMERSEEHTSELQSLMRISYAVFRLKKKTPQHTPHHTYTPSLTTPYLQTQPNKS